MWFCPFCQVYTIVGGLSIKVDRIIYKNASRINRANTREDNLLRTSGSTLAEMPGNTGRSSWII